jgi:hypothetical protein
MVDFCESYSPFHVCLTTCPFAHLVYATSHLSHFIHIWYLDWPWSQHAHIMPISQMVDFCESYSPFHVCLTIRPSTHLVYATSHLSFCRILFIFGILVGHDLSMRILYRFHGWLIFVRVISLFMFVWSYVRSHILCMQLVICLLSHFIHIWYLDWPWSEHAHIISISRMVDFCKSYSPFHVPLRAAAINYFLH